VKEPGAVAGVVKFFSSIAPKLAVFELDDSKSSRDPKVVEAMKSDPLIYDKNGPARTAAEVIGSIQLIEERSKRLDVPVLCLHGGADEVTPPEGSTPSSSRRRRRARRSRRMPGSSTICSTSQAASRWWLTYWPGSTPMPPPSDSPDLGRRRRPSARSALT
jgi:pimeloyl-ACP methyl ester carboxylesterase